MWRDGLKAAPGNPSSTEPARLGLAEGSERDPPGVGGGGRGPDSSAGPDPEPLSPP